MTEDRIDRAERALNELYEGWYEHGGCSPDIRDEARAVAEALGLAEVTDDATLNELWEVGQSGAEVREIAAEHVAALDDRWDRALRELRLDEEEDG